LDVARRQGCGRPGPLQLSLGASQLGLIGTRIDFKEHLAFPDLAPLGEGDPLDVAVHPRPDLHLIHRLEPAGKLIPLRDLALRNGSDRHGLQGRRGGRFILGAAGEGQGHESKTSQTESASENDSPSPHYAVPPEGFSVSA
jgi:hypothetical protein